MCEIQNKIIDKAFNEEWISLEELKLFSENYQKEFGRIKQGIIGAGIGAGVGAGVSALGSAIGGSPELGVGSIGVGAAVGAGLAAIFRNYKVVYLSKDGQVNYVEYTAVNKKGACERLKKDVSESSHVKAFKCPEEDELAMNYSNELRRGKELLDKLLK